MLPRPPQPTPAKPATQATSNIPRPPSPPRPATAQATQVAQPQQVQDWENWDYQTAKLNPRGEALPQNAIGWRPDGTPNYGDDIKGWTSEFAANWKNGDALKTVFTALRPLSLLATGAEGIIGSTAYAISDVLHGKKVDWRGNWEASRLFYGEITNPIFRAMDKVNAQNINPITGKPYMNILKDDTPFSVREEFLKRLQAGERPKDIEDSMLLEGRVSWIGELVGEMILDPLNVLGKVNSINKIMGGRAEKLLNVADTTAAQKLVEASRAGDQITAAHITNEALDEIYASHKAADAGLLDAITGKVSKDAPEFAKELASLLPESKTHLVHATNELVSSELLRMANGDVEEFMRLATMATNLGSSDVLIRQQAAKAVLTSGNPALFLSRAGTMFASFMRQLVTNGDDLLSIFSNGSAGTRLLNSLSGTLRRVEKGSQVAENTQKFKDIIKATRNAKLIEAADKDMKGALALLKEMTKADSTAGVAANLMGYMQAAANKMFPSFAEMINAEEKLAELQKSIDAGGIVKQVSKAKEQTELERLAQMAKGLTPQQRNAAKLQNNLQKVVAPINNALNRLYLSWPSYAFRNMTQNDIIAAIDYGWDGISPFQHDWYELATKLEGGQHIPVPGFGAYGTDKVAKDSAGNLWVGFKDSLKKLDFRPLAEAAEVKKGKRITGVVYVKEYQRRLKTLVSNYAKDPRFSGIPAEMWPQIESKLFTMHGDIEAVLNDMRKQAGIGFVRPFEDVNNAKPFMNVLGDRAQAFVQTVLGAKSKDDAIAAGKALFADLKKNGQELAKVMPIKLDPSDAFEAVLLDGTFSDARRTYLAVAGRVRKNVVSDLAEAARTARNMAVNSKNGIANFAEIEKILPVGWGQKWDDISLKTDKYWTLAKDGSELTKEKWDKLMSVLGDNTSFEDAVKASTTGNPVLDRFWSWKALEWDDELNVGIDAHYAYIDAIEAASGENYSAVRKMLDAAKANFEDYKGFVISDGGTIIKSGGKVATPAEIASLAEKYGITDAYRGLVPNERYLANIIGKYGDLQLDTLDHIDIDMAEAAFRAKTGKALATEDDLRRITRTADDYLLKPPSSNVQPTHYQMLSEMNLDIFENKLTDYITKHFDDIAPIATNSAFGKSVKELGKALPQRLSEIRVMAKNAGTAARDFSLLPYWRKTGFDAATAYLFPYGSWYKGTYKNFLGTRTWQNPAIFSHYAMMKEDLARQHRELPEFWRYSINTDDLGIDLENPLYFNLEQALWSLSGLTGVDFNDPEKRTNWFTTALDNAGKFGPSVWTPITVATGLALRGKGDEEAGNAWLSRLLPFSRVVKDTTGVELDPFVGWFQGGYDKFETAQIGRALYSPELTAKYTREQLTDAANSHSGPAWEDAVNLRNKSHAMGSSLQFLFGSGYKVRTPSDMEIDRFYSEQSKLFTMRPTMSPEDFRGAMQELNNQYPFADYVMLAKKSGEERDVAYAYNVLGRIPPGDMSRLLDSVGITEAQINSFYDDKGDVSKWGQGEAEQFFGALTMVAAVLKLPDGATRQEWNKVRSDYRTVEEEVSKSVGMPYERDATGKVISRGVWDLVDEYFDIREVYGATAADQMKESFPEIQQALDMQQGSVVQNPDLYKYYGSLKELDGYYQGVARKAMTDKYGDDIYDISAQYTWLNNRYKLTHDSQLKAELDAFKKQYYSTLQDFWDERNLWQQDVITTVADIALGMDDTPAPAIRTDISTPAQIEIARNITAPQGVSAEQIMSHRRMSPELLMLVDAYAQGVELSYSADQLLQAIGDDLGIPQSQVIETLLTRQTP